MVFFPFRRELRIGLDLLYGTKSKKGNEAMNESTKTKKALRGSLFALFLCIVLLIGTTFAWFTDTASTGVNKIQSGKLDVDLQMQNDQGDWVSAEGQTLTFKTADNRGADEILWEPGCTYELPELRVVNNGNLALKYKLKINGIQGDEELNKVIDWTYSISGNGGETATSLDTERHLVAKTGDTAVFDTLKIKGHMQESAGNEYQGLSIEGITITVYATQDTVENDSFDNQYDKNAQYAETIAGGKKFTGTETINTGIIAKNPNAIAVKAIGTDADLTITGGTFDGGSGGNNICVAAANDAKVTIKGGTFTVGGDADGYGNSVIYSQGGNIVIEGGFFQTDYHYNGYYYVLNQSNGNPGTITVKGGTFVNYDPSKGDDNLGGNFVASGYKVVSEKHGSDTWYKVVAE